MSIKDQFNKLLKIEKQQSLPPQEDALFMKDPESANDSMASDKKQKIKDNLKGVAFASVAALGAGVLAWSALVLFSTSEEPAMAEVSTEQPIARSLEDAINQVKPENQTEPTLAKPETQPVDSMVVTAREPLPQTKPAKSSVEATLKEKGLTYDKIKSLGSGLNEVIAGKSVFYVSDDGKYIIEGVVSDAKTGDNLTHQTMASLLKMDVSLLNGENSITISYGKAEKEINVFIDPSCPKCKSLYRELSKSNYKVNYYLISLPGFAQSERINRHVWCQELGDMVSTFHRVMTDDKFRATVSNSKSPACKTPFADNLGIMQKAGVPGAPAIYDMNGKFIPAL